MPVKYPLVIFDFDGTLADSFAWFTEALNRVAEEYGLKRLVPDEVEHLRSCDPQTVLRRLKLPFWKLPAIGHRLKALMAQEPGRVRLFPGIEGLLRDLSAAGVRLAMVSSNSLPNVRQVLGSSTTQCIGTYECGVSLLGKAAKLRKVVRQSGVPGKPVLFVGDEIRDLEAAKAAKVDFGAVAWGYNRLEALLRHSPDLVFRCVEDIREGVR